MNNKQKLLKKIKEEFNKNYKDLEFSYEDQQTYHIMSLIIDHIENYYHDDDDELIESIGRLRPHAAKDAETIIHKRSP